MFHNIWESVENTSMKINSFGFKIFLLSLVLGALTACTKVKEPATLRIVSLPFISNAPFFIGIEEGYFEEQGFTVELVAVDRTSQAIPALEQGEVHAVGGLVSTGTINAIVRGANIKAVADKGYIVSTGCNSSALFASKEFVNAHPSKKPEDLKGAEISIVPASMTGYWVEILLKQGNLTLDDIKDFRNSHPEKFELMQEGTIDLVTTDEPWLTRMIQANYGEIWVSYGDLVPDISYSFVWFGPTFLEDDRDLGNRFMVAYLKSVNQYNQGKTDRNLEILEKYLELDRDLLTAACWPAVRNDGSINPDGVLGFEEWALENELIDGKLSVEQFWDPSFIENAAKEISFSE